MIYYIKSNLWQHIYVIQPIEADSEEDAKEVFIKALTGKARDIVIEEVITDDERLQEVIDEQDDDEEVFH